MFHPSFLKFFVVIALTASLTQPTVAQNKTILTLGEAIDIALTRSYNRKTLDLKLLNANYGLKIAKGRFKTNADLQMRFPSFSEQITEDTDPNGLPVFNTRGTTQYQGTLNVNQPLPTDGVFTLSSTLYHRNVSTSLTGLANDIERKEFYASIELQFRQPLFSFNQLKANYEQANLNFERTQKQYKRSEMDLVFSVTQSFYNLYRATRQVQIANEEVRQQKAAYELAKRKYESGFIAEVEALQMEVDYAQSQNNLLSSKSNLENQEDAFKQLVGLELKESITVQTQFDYKPVLIDKDFAIEHALNNRLELRESQIDKRLAEINIKRVSSQNSLKLDLSAFVSFTGISDPNLGDTSVKDLFESSFDDIVSRPNNRGVTLDVSVPLWDWGIKRNEVAQAIISLEGAMLAQKELAITIEREIRAVISQVKQTQNRLEILEKSESIALKSYTISKARFESGSITSQELALDRGRLTAAKTSYLDAFIEYKLASNQLQQKTMYDFEAKRSLVVD